VPLEQEKPLNLAKDKTVDNKTCKAYNPAKTYRPELLPIPKETGVSESKKDKVLKFLYKARAKMKPRSKNSAKGTEPQKLATGNRKSIAKESKKFDKNTAGRKVKLGALKLRKAAPKSFVDVNTMTPQDAQVQQEAKEQFVLVAKDLLAHFKLLISAGKKSDGTSEFARDQVGSDSAAMGMLRNLKDLAEKAGDKISRTTKEGIDNLLLVNRPRFHAIICVHDMLNELEPFPNRSSPN